MKKDKKIKAKPLEKAKKKGALLDIKSYDLIFLNIDRKICDVTIDAVIYCPKTKQCVEACTTVSDKDLDEGYRRYKDMLLQIRTRLDSDKDYYDLYLEKELEFYTETSARQVLLYIPANTIEMDVTCKLLTSERQTTKYHYTNLMIQDRIACAWLYDDPDEIYVLNEDFKHGK